MNKQPETQSVSVEENLLDNVMGTIITNSEGLINNHNGEGYSYASSVYLNNINAELTTLLHSHTHTDSLATEEVLKEILETIRKAVAVDLGPDGMCEIEIGTTKVRNIIKAIATKRGITLSDSNLK